METNVNYTTAGVFVLILLGFIVFGIIWLSAGLNTAPTKKYTINMEESISGLSLDGPVEFNGVKVGTVNDIKIDSKNPQLVRLTIEIEAATPVTRGTRAKLGMRALTGVSYILLEDKGTNMQPIVTLEGQKYPVIPTVPSLLVRLDTMLTEFNDNLKSVSKSITALLDEQNLDYIKQILESGKTTFKILETQTIPRANSALRILETQTLPKTNAAISGFSGMLDEYGSVATGINSLTDDLGSVASEIKENPAVLIRGKAPSTRLGPGER